MGHFTKPALQLLQGGGHASHTQATCAWGVGSVSPRLGNMGVAPALQIGQGCQVGVRPGRDQPASSPPVVTMSTHTIGSFFTRMRCSTMALAYSLQRLPLSPHSNAPNSNHPLRGTVPSAHDCASVDSHSMWWVGCKASICVQIMADLFNLRVVLRLWRLHCMALLVRPVRNFKGPVVGVAGITYWYMSFVVGCY